MTYLDYLPHTPYTGLPAAVRQDIDAATYAELRTVALAVRGERDELPKGLSDSFQKAVLARTRVQSEVVKEPAKRTLWPWLAAAGWLLFLLAAIWPLVERPAENLAIIPPPLAPASAPKIIRQTDTVYVDRISYRTRTKTVRDTVEITREAPERLVLVRDTIYLPFGQPPVEPTPARSLLGKENLLDLLYATD